VIVLGIETSTPHSSVALGSEQSILASISVAGRSHQETVVPTLEHLLRWTGVELATLGGVAVGIGPGLFTGLRVGVETAKALAQVLKIPIVGIASLDSLAFAVRYTRRLIGAVIDARRGEVFFAFYRTVPGGLVREGEYEIGLPEHLAAAVEAQGREVLLVGNGAGLYRRQLEDAGGKVEFASPVHADPQASALVELANPRFVREEFDRLFDVVPLYLRKSDAEIAWDQRTRGA
jgi:tRNA threonylcarbamoyladenosine biosynthesis protein TsaB